MDNYSIDNRKTQSILLDLMPTLFGMAVSGKLTPFLMPTLIKLVILPLLSIVNTISKAFMLIGLLAYLISFSVPLLLSYFGFLQIMVRSYDSNNNF